MIPAKLFLINNLLLILLVVQLSFAVGIYLVCDLKYIPHLYAILLFCYYFMPLPDAYFFFDFQIITLFHWLVVAYLILFTMCSLSPMSSSGDLIYKFRYYARFFVFSATPLRLFTERDLVNMISYQISIAGDTNISYNPFKKDGMRKKPSLYKSFCKPFCLTFALSEFCFLTFSSDDPSCHFVSENHEKICSTFFSKFPGHLISFFQHDYQEKTHDYRTRLVARVIIPSGTDEKNVLTKIRLEKISFLLPLDRFNYI